MTEVVEGRFARVKREKRERMLTEFVDRSSEMEMFKQVLDDGGLPVMVVSAASPQVNLVSSAIRHGLAVAA